MATTPACCGEGSIAKCDSGVLPDHDRSCRDGDHRLDKTWDEHLRVPSPKPYFADADRQLIAEAGRCADPVARDAVTVVAPVVRSAGAASVAAFR